jgi:hypothetical protein
MGSLGPTQLISLLMAVAAVAAVCGFVASTVVRRNKRRARRYILLGFSLGFIAGIIHSRRRALHSLAAVAGQLPRRVLTLAASRGRSASWPMNSSAALIAGRWRRIR